jgi:uncharacterized MnhB-related membrane protein
MLFGRECGPQGKVKNPDPASGPHGLQSGFPLAELAARRGGRPGYQCWSEDMENFPNSASIAFDGILALILLVLAWRLLRSPDLFKAVVLFISFGLMMSLAWVRLKAVDIALAEAAIGAGITGALFLTALGRLRRNESRSRGHQIED